VLFAVVVGVAIPLAAFRLFVPNETFPVNYRRGRTAHLDVTGARHDAIAQALEEQLGVIPVAIKPFNLEGSGGSTPLRITVKGDPETAFGELRPSPWRQAVDLGNMMLVLALRTSPERVYARARHQFSVAEITEAFAATRCPPNSPDDAPAGSRPARRVRRAAARTATPNPDPAVDHAPGGAHRRARDRRRAADRHRRHHAEPDMSRVAVFVAVAAVVLAAGCSSAIGDPVRVLPCTPSEDQLDKQMVLMAQSVPTASAVPCMRTTLDDWFLDDLDSWDGRTRSSSPA
jgi:hypothetical protein